MNHQDVNPATGETGIEVFKRRANEKTADLPEHITRYKYANELVREQGGVLCDGVMYYLVDYMEPGKVFVGDGDGEYIATWDIADHSWNVR